MNVNVILDSIDHGAIALPEFQRGFVWNRKQIRNFMFSLYKKRPAGCLLVWKTRSGIAPARGDVTLQPGPVSLLLDGQQRVTTLYGIIRGKAPEFFDGNKKLFTGLMFHLENEDFEYYGPVKMRDNPFWIDVSKLMMEGLDPYIEDIQSNPDLSPKFAKYIGRLNSIHSILLREFHIEEVSGNKLSLDEVVDIFNMVNSGGTKLSKGDLALAKVCASWPKARRKMRGILDKWKENGFYFKLDWLLRNVTTVVTGQALFADLVNISPEDFQNALQRTEKSINKLLNLISGRLGLDHNRVLGGRYAFPVMSRYLVEKGLKISDISEQNKLLYWYIHSFLWGRYAGSTVTKLNQDLKILEETPNEEKLNKLIDNLRLTRGELIIRPENFSAWSRGARFYPLLYMLTRVCGAQDWGSGIELKADLLGKLSTLNVHHIFPKSLLYKAGYSRVEVNTLANYCFLTFDTNLDISNTPPSEYFREVIKSFPGALESQWIPKDPDLWQIGNYLDFVKARQGLLTEAANKFLNGLLAEDIVDTPQFEIDFAPTMEVIGGIVTDEEEQKLFELNKWVEELDLSPGEKVYELVDETGQLLAMIDLAWPYGVQEGLTDPVAVILDEEEYLEELLNHRGYRFFTSIQDFKDYITEELLEGFPTI